MLLSDTGRYAEVVPFIRRLLESGIRVHDDSDQILTIYMEMSRVRD